MRKAPDMKALKEFPSYKFYKGLKFIAFPIQYRFSQAYAELSPSAKDILLIFLLKRLYHKEGKRKKTVVYHDKSLIFTYSEAEAWGYDRKTFSRALKELTRKGFIRQTHQGGTVGNGKDYSRFALIDDWMSYGTPEFEPREKWVVKQYSTALKRYNERCKHKKKTTFMSGINATIASGKDATETAFQV